MTVVMEAKNKKNAGHRCTTITVSNHKGGCGKTSLCLALAVNAFRQGYSVLLIDMDQQGSLGKQFNINGNDKAVEDYRLSTVYTKITSSEPTVISPLFIWENKDSASKACISILLGDHNLKDVVERVEESAERSESFDGESIVLERFTNLIESYRNIYDYIIFDTTPVIDIVKCCAHALSVADCVVIPFDSYNAIDEIDETKQVIDRCSKSNPNIVFVSTKYTKDSQAFAKKFDEQCEVRNLPRCAMYSKVITKPRRIGQGERRNTFCRIMTKVFPDNMCIAGIPSKADIERYSYLRANRDNQEIIDDVCKEILLKSCRGAKGEIEDLCNKQVWSKKRTLLNKYIGILRDVNIKDLNIKKQNIMFRCGGKLSVQFEKEETFNRMLLEREAFRNK